MNIFIWLYGRNTTWCILSIELKGRDCSAKGDSCLQVQHVVLGWAQPARDVWGAGEQVCGVKKHLGASKWNFKRFWRCLGLCLCLSKHTSRCMCERDKEASTAGTWRQEKDWKFWTGRVPIPGGISEACGHGTKELVSVMGPVWSCWWFDLIILKVFTNLNDSVILSRSHVYCRECVIRNSCSCCCS